MDEHNARPLSPSEAEDFWAGEGASLSAPDEPPEQPNLTSAAAAARCCAGADLPGVGRVHSDDCPHKGSPVRSGRGHAAGELPRPLRESVGGVNFELGTARPAVLRGREGEPGEVPATLRDHMQDEDRNRLLIELSFAARRLTDLMLIARRYPYRESDYCKYCLRWLSGGHAPGCDVETIVRALNALEEMAALAPKGGTQ